MGRLFFLGSLSSIALISLVRPWIGVVAAYGIAVLTPQAIWFWNFDGVRPALWILAPTLVGFLLAVMRNEHRLTPLLNRRTLYMALFWAAITFSYLAGPYVDVVSPNRFLNPAIAASTMNKIFLLYFIACVCIDNEKRLKALAGVIVVSAAYLTYWANDRYLSGLVIGRLAGPVDVYGFGPYVDENNFAMLFVIAVPFFWYAGHLFQNAAIRWGLWLLIPFAWHALFLTASRGGLVGLGVVTLLCAWRSKNKFFGFLIIPALVVAYVWQAGDLMRDRATTITNYQTETSASTRLEAWETALKMIAAEPLTGVGLSSFAPAFPDFSDYHPREAHNTFLQLAAETGVIGGLMYAMIVLGTILTLWRNGNRLRSEAQADESSRSLYLMNEAILVALSGFAVCALFLSLQMFEIFYLLCVLANALLFVQKQHTASKTSTVQDHRIRVTGAPARAAGRAIP